VARALEFVAAHETSGQTDLPAGLRLLRESGRLWLAAREADLPDNQWPQLPLGGVFRLEVPGELALPESWVLRAERIDDLIADLANVREQVFRNDDPHQAWLDLDRLHLPLGVRSCQPGDRIQPLGMQGHSLKLADLMVNLKLPQRARDRWPLVLSGDELAWIPGLRQAHPFRVTVSTKRIVRLSLVRATQSGPMPHERTGVE
jgi:tRNA(Ile)-lysidine synthase